MKKRVLVCDRKSLARTAYEGTLRLNGYEIAGETTVGMEVLPLYQSLKPDLVLMSAILAEPGGDGLGVIALLLDHDPDAKIVAYANPEICSKAACLAAGAKAFFEYPARPDEMLAVVRDVIG